MGRKRSPNRDKAFQIYKEHGGKITSKEIAEILDEKINNINSWRTRDKWSKMHKKIGAPYGNKNAIGNKGGAPIGNYNRFTYGKYTDRIPFAVKNIMQELDIEDPLEKQWRSICLLEARIIYMQDIMHVENKEDMTKILKKISDGKTGKSLEYEIQHAWDKESNLMNTLSRSMNTLAKLIKQYDEMLNANWDIATEEQKLRVERLKIQIENPELQHRKEIANKKIELERERFEHTKKMDEFKNF